MSDNYQSLKYTDRDIDNVYEWSKKFPLEKVRGMLSSNPDGKELTTQDVIHATAIVFNINNERLSAGGRGKKDAIYEKHIARYIAYYYTRGSGNEIAKDIGGTCHSNFFIGRKKLHEMLPFDWQLREHLRMVLGYLRSSNFKLEYKERQVGLKDGQLTSSSFKPGHKPSSPGRKGIKNKPKTIFMPSI